MITTNAHITDPTPANRMSCYSDHLPPEIHTLVVVRAERVDPLGIWGSLPDWGNDCKAYLPIGALAKQRGRGERKAQAKFLTTARRRCGKANQQQPLVFVGCVQAVEQMSADCVADFNTVSFHVTVSRRGVTDEEEAATLKQSRELHLCASLLVDKAAAAAGVDKRWARCLTLYKPYHQACRDRDGGNEDIKPETAAIDLLLNRIGRLPPTGSDEDVAKLLDENNDNIVPAYPEFCSALLKLCQEEAARRSQPITHTIEVAVGGRDAAMELVSTNPGDFRHAFDVSIVKSSLSAASTITPPQGCGPVELGAIGSGKFTLSTMAPPAMAVEALEYLSQASAAIQGAWEDAALRGGQSSFIAPSEKKKQVPLDTVRVQPSLNIGVIGDVANGKSTLVRAMSGKRTQSHSKEQQQHGITIRLGFANAAVLQCRDKQVCGSCAFLPESEDRPDAKLPKCVHCKGPMEVVTRVSFIDCPGHAELMATMLAGASAFDAVILAAAANVPCPTPQAKQHLEALRLSGSLAETLGNVAIAQTKAELVADRSQDAVSLLTPLAAHAAQGRRALKKTVAANAPFFPVCAPLGLGLQPLAEWIVNLHRSGVGTHITSSNPVRLNVLRSFDINRPGIKTEGLKGGVLGGTPSGHGLVSVGDELEIRPGVTLKQNTNQERNTFQVQPLRCQCTALMTGKTQLSSASKGGLVAIGTTVCPSLTAENGMVGAVVGAPGTLPPVWGPNLYLDSVNFVSLAPENPSKAKLGQAVLVKSADALTKGCPVRCHVGSATVKGTVVRLSSRHGKIQLLLKDPVCGCRGASVALEAKPASGTYVLAAHARIYGGDCCMAGTEEEASSDSPTTTPRAKPDLTDPDDSDDDDEDDDFEGEQFEKDEERRGLFLSALESYSEQNQLLADGAGARLTVPAPKLRREGGAHIMVDNFGVIAASLHRDVHHVMAFLQKEGGLSCVLAGASKSGLRISWRGGKGFAERLSSILKKYALAYVACHQCRGAVTELLGGNKTCEVSCRRCNARRFVAKL